MQIKIGACNPATETVEVTFTYNGVTHKRAVNAVINSDGSYNDELTVERVNEVSLGVKEKIDLGVITNPSGEEVSQPPVE